MHYTKFISGLRKLKNDMPILVGNECVNFALDNIRVMAGVLYASCVLLQLLLRLQLTITWKRITPE
jgi:hypothetical protein